MNRVVLAAAVLVGCSPDRPDTKNPADAWEWIGQDAHRMAVPGGFIYHYEVWDHDKFDNKTTNHDRWIFIPTGTANPVPVVLPERAPEEVKRK